MTNLVRALDAYQIAIYLVLAIGGLFAFRWLWKSWREWQMSVFKLEREFAISFVIPGLPAGFFLPTPTIDPLAQPIGTLSPDAMTQAAVAPQPAVSANMQGCVPDQLMITSPKPGAEVKGRIDVVGTVNIANFGFYKYEVALRGSDTWATILAGTEVKINGQLGPWDTAALTPGDYQLRLVVTDNRGVSLAPCIIPVRILAP